MELKANELRIGNYVMTNFKREDEIVDIKAIDFIENYIKLYKPIPLTEENSTALFGKTLTEICCDIMNNNIMIAEICNSDLLKLKVHEVQNIYYSLLKEEL